MLAPTMRERLEQSRAVPNEKVSVRCDLWAVPMPLAAPISASTVPTFDTVHHVVVVLRSEGLTGWGYSAHRLADGVQEAVAEAEQMLSVVPMDLGALLRLELDRLPMPAVRAEWSTRLATNAIALAAWDLAAKRIDVSCADAWGAGDVDELDCYMSDGFFISVPEHKLADAAARARRENYRKVKVRGGQAPNVDARRVGIVREQFSDDGTVAMDALHGWDVAATRAFVDEVGAPLMWVEDPVPDQDLADLEDLPQPIAAGELLVTSDEFRALTRSARIDVVLPDVMVVGGPGAFLSAAEGARAEGVRIGAHLFAEFSAHLLACVDDPGPLETFTWSDPLFDEPLRPNASGRMPVRGPGFGVDLDEEVLARLGDHVSAFGS